MRVSTKIKVSFVYPMYNEIGNIEKVIVGKYDEILLTVMAYFAEGHVLRPVGRGDHVRGERLTEKVIWQLLRPYSVAAGVPGIAPHDLRRSCAKMCRAAGGELEQIQLLLGHASVQTTERYLGTKQDLVNAPNDGIKLRGAI